MSGLSFMDKLLDGVDVEFITLNELVTLQRGKRLVKSELQELGEYAVFQNSMTPLGYYHESNVSADTTFIICAGAAGEIGYSDKDFWAADDVFSLKVPTHVNSKYLYHGLLAQKGKILSQVRRASIPRLSRSSVEKLVIPIPCPENPEKSLQIQAEIVRILDAFTSLTAELTAELTARKKQYNYYRDKLLSFEEGEVEWKSLGEVVKIKNGKDWKSLGTGNIPVYGSGGVMNHVDSFAYDKPTVLIPRKGSITNIFYVDEPFWNVDTIYYTEIDTSQLTPKFFYYFMRTVDLMKLDTGSGRPSLTQAILNTILVPVPELEKQATIVNTLDKFDALTNSITEGLPREIELRQKQYEYYRDLLLSFPKPDEKAA
ncbi:MAG: type I site-specific restriction-modification system specificity subunit HsdS [Idiomarinaceae bacterium HL-53]|nr:MAG: type I site-specific restriction-modification system specificity subunit HsdS [Idiomarinaceae bacterium HL-53]CUS47992.1 type I restriction enzyme, S subunit [Idiomarinaceae bacterium HL-53]